MRCRNIRLSGGPETDALSSELRGLGLQTTWSGGVASGSEDVRQEVLWASYSIRYLSDD
jgi:hypothetical protein